MVRDLSPDAYNQYLPTVWSLLFTRLQTSRTPRFSHGFGVFLSLFICAAGTAAVVSSMDTVQPGIFGMVAQQVWLPTWPSIEAGSDEGKLLTVAATKVLTECPAIYSNQALWQEIRNSLETRLRGESSVCWLVAPILQQPLCSVIASLSCFSSTPDDLTHITPFRPRSFLP